MKREECLDIVQRMIADGIITQDDAAKYFSELAESEDERIRRGLINGFNFYGEQEYWGTDKFQLKVKDIIAYLEKQGEPNPYSGVSFKYNGHTWGMCARDNGVEILIDGHLKGRVFTNNDSNAKEMFIKALERVEEQKSKGYKLTDCDKNSWWEDFKAYTSDAIEQKPQGKSALEAINEEKVDNANKVEQKPAWSEEDEKLEL